MTCVACVRGATNARCFELFTSASQENAEKPSQFGNNVIKTSHYTKYNFIFKNLKEQFSRGANIYFLWIVIMQMIPPISVTGGYPATAFPLAVVVLTSALKDIVEDYRRHKSDAKENTQPCWVVGASKKDSSSIQLTPLQASSNISPRSDKSSSPVMSLDTQSLQQVGTASTEHCSRRSEAKLSLMPVNFDPKSEQNAYPVREMPRQSPQIRECINARILYEKDWKNVLVGDLIVCSNREKFPADMILLASSDPGHIAFINTASLDGESNLKVRHAFPKLRLLFGPSLAELCLYLTRCKGYVHCSPPNLSLSTFNGRLQLASKTPDSNFEVNLSSDNLLLRGCTLRNTDWIVGLVVYTGSETKIQLNSTKIHSKVSSTDVFTNWLMVWILIIEIAIAAGLTAAASSFLAKISNYTSQYMFLYTSQSENGNEATRFFTAIILIATIIPISLIFSLKMIRFAQGYFIERDEDMVQCGQGVCVRNSDLNDDLGKITYFFTDKTGTLTRNYMEFSEFFIHKADIYREAKRPVYEGRNNAASSSWRRSGVSSPDARELDLLIETTAKLDSREAMNQMIVTPHVVPDIRLVRSQVESDLAKALETNNVEPTLDFLLHLAVNHSVIIDVSGSHHPDRIAYSSSSPDEEAFIYGASHQGVQFVERTMHQCTLQIITMRLDVEILATLHFDSSRRRSSVLCRYRFSPSAPYLYVLYTKGADSVILGRLAVHPEHQNLVDSTKQILEDYATNGLRTLCLAKRSLSEQEAFTWSQEYENLNFPDASGHVDQQNVIKHIEKLECSLEFQGIVGVRDLLQDDVPETIQAMHAAGMHVWMLTGDKLETAVNIGMSSGLVPRNSTLFILDSVQLKEKPDSGSFQIAAERSSPPHDTLWQHRLREELTHIHSLLSRFPSESFQAQASHSGVLQVLHRVRQALRITRSTRSPDVNYATPFRTAIDFVLVIDGEALDEVLKEHQLQRWFFEISNRCATTICCRTTPSMKSVVVKLVKSFTNELTLAVGDGANDCPMIQSADIGVGIWGSEGLKAFNVSDYGISEFRVLKPLLLCHGRWCHSRVCSVIKYMFFKNFLAILPIVFFSMDSSFSGQKIYHEAFFQLYNVILTAVPIIILGVFERDISKSDCVLYPSLYRLGPQGHYLSPWQLMGVLVKAALYAALAFWIPYEVFVGSHAIVSGQPADIWIMGQVVYGLVIIFATLQVYFMVHLYSVVLILTIVLSIAVWFIFLKSLSVVCIATFDVTGSAEFLLASPLFYMVMIGLPLAVASVSVFTANLTWNVFPEAVHVIHKKRLGMHSPLIWKHFDEETGIATRTSANVIRTEDALSLKTLLKCKSASFARDHSFGFIEPEKLKEEVLKNRG